MIKNLLLPVSVLLTLFCKTAFSDENGEPPLSLDNVAQSVAESLIEIWSTFVGRIPYFAAGLIVLLLTWLASSILSMIAGRMMRRSGLRYSLQELLSRFVSIGIWILGILLSAMIIFPGLTPSKAIGAMGIASIAVGLAFKDIFENFFAGILLLWRFPFENGDVIECGDILGRVENVALRMTKIRLLSGELIVCPNSFLFKNPVKVLTNQKIRRTNITTGIAYDENIEKAVKVIREAVKNCPSVHTNEEIQVVPSAFGSSSIDIEIYWWTDALPKESRDSKGEVITAVKNGLDEANIEIPYPYRTLTFKESLVIDQKGE
ncbi:MAG: mechanosensitive ion channel family protein [Desulforhopalus sp.]